MRYQVSICDGALRTSFKVTNEGAEDFTCTCEVFHPQQAVTNKGEEDFTFTCARAPSTPTSHAVTNKGEEDFTFTCALHTYFACGSLNAAVIGLKGSSYEVPPEGFGL
ncbi:hypothetical protein T484DRAFT_1795537 [Baffinella frigidus]|nr:hypothetical protein T484DRAFT_1795537 [Cryptophyta sp. CCMP2293]